MQHVFTYKWLSGGTKSSRDFGWTQVAGKEMYQTPISGDVALAPDALLKIINCSCEEIQCRTNRCGSRQSNLAFLVFYACQGGHRCFNDKTRQTLQANDDDDDDDN